MVIILGHIDVHEGDASAFAELARIMAAQTIEEVGCVYYSFAADVSRTGRFQLSECWEDSDALATHFKSSHMATFRAGIYDLRIQSRFFKKYQTSRAEDLGIPIRGESQDA